MGRGFWEMPSDYELWQAMVIKCKKRVSLYRKKVLADKPMDDSLKLIKKAIQADIKEGRGIKILNFLKLFLVSSALDSRKQNIEFYKDYKKMQFEAIKQIEIINANEAYLKSLEKA